MDGVGERSGGFQANPGLLSVANPFRLVRPPPAMFADGEPRFRNATFAQSADLKLWLAAHRRMPPKKALFCGKAVRVGGGGVARGCVPSRRPAARGARHRHRAHAQGLLATQHHAVVRFLQPTSAAHGRARFFVCAALPLFATHRARARRGGQARVVDLPARSRRRLACFPALLQASPTLLLQLQG